MKRSFNPASVPQAIALESVQVASPCHADWNAMHGDERSRFCPSCAKNVYNLSAMTRPEAELLLQEKEGRLCVRFYVREDGTMLTQDCPVGAAALKQRSPSFALWAGVASVFVLVGALLSPSLVTGVNAQPESPSHETPSQTVAPVVETPVVVGEPMMGDVAPAPRPTAIPKADLPAIHTLGELTVQNTPCVKPTAEPSTPIMGKPTIPQQLRPTMGRIATPKPTPVPTATPAPTPSGPVIQMMGAVSPMPRPNKQT
ncbi:hypothetical protein EON83_16455, partial [bacterium]